MIDLIVVFAGEEEATVLRNLEIRNFGGLFGFVEAKQESELVMGAIKAMMYGIKLFMRMVLTK